MENKKILAFDIGGTKIAHALLTASGDICGEIIKNNTPHDAEEIFNLLQNILRGYGDTVSAVAVATAGEVDRDNIRIIASVGNMPEGYINTAFQKLTEKPLLIENDGNAAVWCEYKKGAAKGADNVVLLAIGTGVGAGIIVDGHLLKGKSGAAAEMHFGINRGNQRQCSCGAYDCFEAYASGTALGANAREFFNNPTLSSHDIVRGMLADNIDCRKVFDIWQNDILTGIVALSNIFDPEVFVMFGSLSEFLDYDYLQKAANKRIVCEPIKLCRAKYENNAAMIGATLLCAEKFNLR